MSLRPLAAVLSLVLVLGFAASAHAVIIPFASRVAFDAAFPGALVEDWDGFAAGTTFPDGTTVAGITYTSSAGDALVTDIFLASSGVNGLGDSTVGFFGGGDTMTFEFTTPMSAFGIDINTFAVAAGAYTATTDGGDVIPSVFDPFPGEGTGQFAGFSSTVAFSAVTITPVSGIAYTLDTLRRVPAGIAVPGAPSFVLVTLGLAGLAALRRPGRRD